MHKRKYSETPSFVVFSQKQVSFVSFVVCQKIRIGLMAVRRRLFGVCNPLDICSSGLSLISSLLTAESSTLWQQLKKRLNR